MTTLNSLKVWQIAETEDSIDYCFSPQLHATYDKEQRALWTRWTPTPRPCFNMELLNDLGTCAACMQNSNALVYGDGGELPLEYFILGSGVPGTYNLGGDLNLFASLITSRDREMLLQYAHLCIQMVYALYSGFGQGIIPIALIEGDCFGGGFEAALACHLRVGERSALFGLPESRFNLYPGMGAYSLLERQIGFQKAEEMICTGKTYRAEDGEGVTAVEALIQERRRNQITLSAISHVRRRIHAIDFSELRDIVDLWVETALRLSESDLRTMRTLVRLQNRKYS